VSGLRQSLLWRLALLVGASLAATGCGADLIQLNFGARVLTAEVADTPAAREVGLMHRPAMPENQGMLFVFPADGRQCMWMKDTLIPLSVAFIDAQGHIVNIADMQPHSREIHCSAGPVRYALEMNRGWFQRRAVQAGDLASGIQRLHARR
jgi:uncharacterized protein